MAERGTQIEKCCYLCGSTEKLTREHVPPRGLFPKPKPGNLLTVPCCLPCNNKASRDVEYFRLATSTLINKNAQGTRAWKRVVSSTIPSGRIQDLIEVLRKRARPTRLHTSTGIVDAMQFVFDAERINRILVSITRGFLTLWNPEIENSQLDFEIVHMHQFKLETTATFVRSEVGRLFVPYTVGDGVYRHWRGLVTDDCRHGLWIHVFYDAASWLVKHSPGDGRITMHGAKDWEQRL